jgi:hypothetical protein
LGYSHHRRRSAERAKYSTNRKKGMLTGDRGKIILIGQRVRSVNWQAGTWKLEAGINLAHHQRIGKRLQEPLEN